LLIFEEKKNSEHGKKEAYLSTFLLIRKDKCHLSTYPWGIRTS